MTSVVEKFLRIFDQYLGVWVGILLSSTILMGWIDKMFVWRTWNQDLRTYVSTPMFPTPTWWVDPLGPVVALVGLCLGKLAAGYYTNSRFNSEPGKAPEVRSDKMLNKSDG